MRIYHIRHASMILETGDERVLVDPCLNPKGTLPPYTLFRKRPRLNPLTGLPPGALTRLGEITSGLVTHCRFGHFDHLDGAGARLLARTQVPVYCTPPDRAHLAWRGIRALPLAMGVKSVFPAGAVTPFPTAHGHGILGRLMGPGAGYFLELDEGITVYLAGDTVMTPVVRRVLGELKPDIAVVNAGTAALDLGRPILMPLPELLEFMRAAPGRVVAVHLDAFNHCLTTRAALRDTIEREGLSGKVLVPEDGELLEL